MHKSILENAQESHGPVNQAPGDIFPVLGAKIPAASLSAHREPTKPWLSTGMVNAAARTNLNLPGIFSNTIHTVF